MTWNDGVKKTEKYNSTSKHYAVISEVLILNNLVNKNFILLDSYFLFENKVDSKINLWV